MTHGENRPQWYYESRAAGKPNYQIAKAYRPIALLNTLAKVVTALVATDISFLVENHHLIPKTHFGGRPGKSTIDALHYLSHRIKEAWRKKEVVSVLFLDIEGAFPNAVTKRLIHNLRKRRIPAKYVKFVENLLKGRRMRLRFDDYTSEPIEIRNGIGQGDPLSMILYIIYNADLLEIVDHDKGEDALGYVDDVAILATGKNYEETTNKIEAIMTKDGGGIKWSREHNSKFEISKSVILHAGRKAQEHDNVDTQQGEDFPSGGPTLKLNGQPVQKVKSFKYWWTRSSGGRRKLRKGYQMQLSGYYNSGD